MACTFNAADYDVVFSTVASGSTVPSMGIGLVGAANITYNRKFRFLFGITYCNGDKKVSPAFVKLAALPSITVEDTELNFLNSKTWIPGKAAWETITVTYLDVSGDPTPQTNGSLYSWLATVYDFTSPCNHMATKGQDWAGEASVVRLDGCGNVLDQWIMKNAFPTSIKFSELDYSSSDVCEVELTLRYSDVTYIPICPPAVEPCECTPCE